MSSLSIGAVAAVAAGAMVAGCGTSSVTTLVVGQKAYASTIAAQSARVTMTDTIDSPKQKATSTVTGVVAWAPRMMSVQGTSTANGITQTSTEILDGSTAYWKNSDPLPGAEGQAKPWLKIPLPASPSQPAGVLDPTLDPSQTLAQLKSASRSVTKVGTATIDGTPTSEYRAVIDLAKATAGQSNGSSAGASLRQELGTSSLPVEFWVNGQGRLSQFAETMTIKTFPSSTGISRAVAQALAGTLPLTFTTTMDFTDYGVPVHITPPPASEVQSPTDVGSLSIQTKST